jgi:hypothetical protein
MRCRKIIPISKKMTGFELIIAGFQKLLEIAFAPWFHRQVNCRLEAKEKRKKQWDHNAIPGSFHFLLCLVSSRVRKNTFEHPFQNSDHSSNIAK